MELIKFLNYSIWLKFVIKKQSLLNIKKNSFIQNDRKNNQN